MKYGHIEVISTQCAICNSKRNFIIQHLAGQIRNQKMILPELPLNHSELLLSMIWIIQDKKLQKLWFISKNIKAASLSFRKKIQVEKIIWKSIQKRSFWKQILMHEKAFPNSKWLHQERERSFFAQLLKRSFKLKRLFEKAFTKEAFITKSWFTNKKTFSNDCIKK